LAGQTELPEKRFRLAAIDGTSISVYPYFIGSKEYRAPCVCSAKREDNFPEMEKRHAD